jgi:hypothetical protein
MTEFQILSPFLIQVYYRAVYKNYYYEKYFNSREVHLRFDGKQCLQLQGRKDVFYPILEPFLITISSTMKMQTACFSETSVNHYSINVNPILTQDCLETLNSQ